MDAKELLGFLNWHFDGLMAVVWMEGSSVTFDLLFAPPPASFQACIGVVMTACAEDQLSTHLQTLKEAKRRRLCTVGEAALAAVISSRLKVANPCRRRAFVAGPVSTAVCSEGKRSRNPL